MLIRLAPSVERLLRLAFVQLADMRVSPSPPELSAAMEEQARVWRERYSGREPSQIPELQPARQLYRAIGMDPTRTRPSSEALLRRALQGKPIFSVNSVVDAGNLYSLAFLLPIGLYDLGLVEGDVMADLGGPGDGYDGIRKDRVNVEGRLALRDRVGPFGNPSSDSLRTSIRDTTRSVLLTLFAPADTPTDQLRRALEAAGALQSTWGGGSIVEQGIVEPGS